MPDLQWYSYAEKYHMKIKSYKNKTRLSNHTVVIRTFHIYIEG